MQVDLCNGRKTMVVVVVVVLVAFMTSFLLTVTAELNKEVSLLDKITHLHMYLV